MFKMIDPLNVWEFCVPGNGTMVRGERGLYDLEELGWDDTDVALSVEADEDQWECPRMVQRFILSPGSFTIHKKAGYIIFTDGRHSIHWSEGTGPFMNDYWLTTDEITGVLAAMESLLVSEAPDWRNDTSYPEDFF